MNESPEQQLIEPVPSIRLLRIERFRGIEKLEWQPAKGMNIHRRPG